MPIEIYVICHYIPTTVENKSKKNTCPYEEGEECTEAGLSALLDEMQNDNVTIHWKTGKYFFIKLKNIHLYDPGIPLVYLTFTHET